MPTSALHLSFHPCRYNLTLLRNQFPVYAEKLQEKRRRWEICKYRWTIVREKKIFSNFSKQRLRPKLKPILHMKFNTYKIAGGWIMDGRAAAFSADSVSAIIFHLVLQHQFCTFSFTWLARPLHQGCLKMVQLFAMNEAG